MSSSHSSSSADVPSISTSKDIVRGPSVREIVQRCDEVARRSREDAEKERMRRKKPAPRRQLLEPEEEKQEEKQEVDEPKEEKKLTEDETKCEREINLYHAMEEYVTVASGLRDFLELMIIKLPDYIKSSKKRRFIKEDGSDIVSRISIALDEIFPIQKLFVKELLEIKANWDSSAPNLCGTILKFADFFKRCHAFLEQYNKLYEEFSNARKCNKKLDKIISKFEIENKSLTLCMEFARVHQFLTRQNLLISRYKEFLEDGPEMKKADQAAARMNEVAFWIEKNLQQPKSEEVLELHQLLKGFLNALFPGRVLIQKGFASVISGKKQQLVYLVLFNDFFLICVPNSSKLENGFILEKSKKYFLSDVTFGIKKEGDKGKHLLVSVLDQEFLMNFTTEKLCEQWKTAAVQAQKLLKDNGLQTLEVLCKTF